LLKKPIPAQTRGAGFEKALGSRGSGGGRGRNTFIQHT